MINYFLCGILLTLACADIAIGMSVLGARKSKTARTMFWLTIVVSIYLVGYSMELAALSLDSMITSNYIQYFAIPFYPTLWFYVFKSKIDERFSGSRFTSIVTYAVPALTFIMRMTNDIHHLFYMSIAMDDSGSFPVLVLKYGPFAYLYMAYMAFLVAVVLRALCLNSKGNNKIARRRNYLLALATTLPFLLWCFAKLIGSRLDLVPFGLMAAVILLPIIIYKYEYTSFSPFAQYNAFRSMDVPVLIVDNNANIIEFNGAARQIFPGLDEEQSLQRLSEVTDQASELEGYIKDSDMQNKHERLIRINERDYSLTIEGLNDKDESSIRAHIMVFSDVTGYIATLKQLNYYATTDELTGLWNRRYFYEQCNIEIKRAVRYNKPISMIIMDLDYFKTVNDTYGHLAGDIVLQKVAALCRESVRGQDILGRYGGEEFVALLPETDLENAKTVAKRIGEKLAAERIRIGDDEITITASFGVTGFDEQNAELTLDRLLSLADKALYKVKKSGRNRIYAIDPKENA